MISAIVWVPAGVADPNPKKYEFSAAERDLIQMMEDQNFDGPPLEEDATALEEEEQPEEPEPIKKKITIPQIENNLPADLRMDEYSSDEDENDAVQGTEIGRLLLDDKNDILEEMQDDDEEEDDEESDVDEKDDMDSDASEDSEEDDDLADVPDTREYTPIDVEGLNALGLSQAGTSAPAYMDAHEHQEEDDDSAADDVRLQPDDAIIVVAKTEEDFAALEVHVYEQRTGNLFVHHDIPLPAFPLCLAQGDIGPTGSAGNFCAVGTFSPGIEIWNLDVLNALEPSCILGGEDTSMADDIMRHNMTGGGGRNKMKLKAPQGSKLRTGSHTDAIMCLSWNKVHRQIIASGSADCTVKLWDVTQAGTEQCNAGTFHHHKDKVQSVVWHPTEGTLLATGSYDRTVCLVDARSSDNIKRVKLPADCETLAWDPFSPQYLTAASEDGTIMCWDVRKFSDKTPLWSVVANEYGGVSDLTYNPHVPGMLATCSVDKTVTLWDTHNKAVDGAAANYDGPPKACGNKDMVVGKLYTVQFYPSSPWLLGCAGGGKELALWDMTREDSIQKRFGDRVVRKQFGDRVSGDGEQQKDEEPVNESEQKKAFDAMMTPSTPSATTKEGEVNPSPKKASLSKKKKNGKEKKKKPHRAGK